MFHQILGSCSTQNSWPTIQPLSYEVYKEATQLCGVQLTSAASGRPDTLNLHALEAGVDVSQFACDDVVAADHHSTTEVTR